MGPSSPTARDPKHTPKHEAPVPQGLGLRGPRNPLRTGTEKGADPGRGLLDGLSSFKAGPLASALGAGGPVSIWQTSMWPALQGLQDLIKPELLEG